MRVIWFMQLPSRKPPVVPLSLAEAWAPDLTLLLSRTLLMCLLKTSRRPLPGQSLSPPVQQGLTLDDGICLQRESGICSHWAARRPTRASWRIATACSIKAFSCSIDSVRKTASASLSREELANWVWCEVRAAALVHVEPEVLWRVPRAYVTPGSSMLDLNLERGWGNIVTLIGRFKPGVTVAQALDDANRAAQYLFQREVSPDSGPL